jgi:DNA-binding GntR family transcriptional regulator
MYTTGHTARDAATPVASKRASARLLREEAYRELRRLVLTGEFPFGLRLGEEAVAEQLGISRTPAREAMLRLHADRLLNQYADGGFYVAEPDLMDLRDLYELRLALELHAITRAGADGINHDRGVLEAIHSKWTAIKSEPPQPDGSFIELDENFHVSLCRASGNIAIVEMLETVNARIRPVRMYDFLTSDRIALSIDEHLAITEAVLVGELDSAARLMREHIGASLEVVEERAATAMARMIRGRSRRNKEAR